MIRVHHLNRSRSLRILWLLEELSLPYEVVRYERDSVTNLAPESLRAVHPLGKSPMIEMDGMLITESAAIVERVCQKHAPQMIPGVETEVYARHLEWMHFAEGSAMTPILLNLYVGKLGEAGAALHPRIQSELESHFKYMNDSLRPSGHYVLDDLSAADIMMSFPAQVAIRLGRGDEFRGLKGFVEHIQARPAFARAVAKGGGD